MVPFPSALRRKPSGRHSYLILLVGARRDDFISHAFLFRCTAKNHYPASELLAYSTHRPHRQWGNRVRVPSLQPRRNVRQRALQRHNSDQEMDGRGKKYLWVEKGSVLPRSDNVERIVGTQLLRERLYVHSSHLQYPISNKTLH